MRHRVPAHPALIAVLVLLCGCSSPATSPTPEASLKASEAPASVALPSPSGPPTSRLDDVAAFDVTVELSPDWPALLADSLWVLTPDGDEPAVVRLDPKTGAERARIPTPGGGCEMLAAGFGAIWACTPDGVIRIDPATNAVVATVAFKTPQAAGRLAIADDAIWTTSGDIAATDLVRIDPKTNSVTGTYALGHAVQQITFGLGYVWATATRDGLLLRIDPASGEVTTAASDLVDPLPVAVGAARVWVGLQGRPTDEDPDPSVPDLFRFDPATGTGDSFDYGMKLQPLKSANTLFADDTGVWVKGEDPFLMELKPQTGEVEWIVTSDRGSGAIVIAGRTLWMTLWRDNSVVRIDL